MIEGEPISTQIEERSEEVLSNQDWQQEQTLRSSELIVIRGMVGGEQRGALLASFIIERELEGDKFQEKLRRVKLSSVSVWSAFQRRGLGIAVLDEVERLAKHFGASHIEGTLAAVDLEEKPWLSDYYRKRGFELKQKGAGYEMVKRL